MVLYLSFTFTELLRDLKKNMISLAHEENTYEGIGCEEQITSLPGGHRPYSIHESQFLLEVGNVRVSGPVSIFPGSRIFCTYSTSLLCCIAVGGLIFLLPPSWKFE